MRVVEKIAGWETDPVIAERLHALAHRQAVEYVHLAVPDLDRSRLRVTSDAGADYAVALPRGTALADGAVLVLDDERAVVVRAGAARTLELVPGDIAAALRLGYLAGHLHWKVDQHGERLLVHLQGPEADYTSRICELLDTGRVRRCGDG
ncbi:urease accessory protein UreE [Mycolicibacterium canariasense]|nr:urease accessory protein UreE [Mycolicibacterium canariasense]